MKRYSNFQKFLNEYIAYSNQYIYMGWIDPKGKWIYPTEQQLKDPNIGYNHSELLLRGTAKEYDQESLKGEIYKHGYIRVMVEYYDPDTLYLTFSPYYVTYDQIKKGLQNIEKSILSGELYKRSDTPQLRRKFPNGIPIPKNISVGVIFHKQGTGRSAQYRSNEYITIVPFNASSVWNFVEKVKEERPPTKYDLTPPTKKLQ